MKLKILGTINKDNVNINVATFHLKDGGSITLDRKHTNYSIKNGLLSMEWSEIYMWKINDECIFENQNVYQSANLLNLLNDSWIELELEENSDADSCITDIKWALYDNQLSVFGTDIPAKKYAEGDYLLLTTNGYSLDEYAFYEKLADAKTAMIEAYNSEGSTAI